MYIKLDRIAEYARNNLKNKFTSLMHLVNKVYDGTPQGGIISPTLANINLHYVLDIWFNNFIKKRCKGEAYIVRYADDFVCCFEYENEAKAFYEALKNRLNKFSLEVAENKTKILYFGKNAYI